MSFVEGVLVPIGDGTEEYRLGRVSGRQVTPYTDINEWGRIAYEQDPGEEIQEEERRRAFRLLVKRLPPDDQELLRTIEAQGCECLTDEQRERVEEIGRHLKLMGVTFDSLPMFG